ncbi:desulfoferrodoxin family protein [uncultured Methanobrevibacter sp.]|uniref:desulfoferrodoxin family protein n=1 Tax=uncultured Methanobrevibacter sp. TaxID=253161 RepID=UPI002612F19B|nr:desulfoferrodoxin family protein [uncultured Methanobrevibacter sp.]
MVEYGKIFKCDDCGSIVEVLVGADAESKSCDTSINVLEPQTDGDKAPKHVPVVSIEGNKVIIAVGEVQHPMDDDHFIQFVELNVGDETYIKHFKPGDIPKATFTVDADLLEANEPIAKEFCNLHGLWASQ